jgi:hypothetical protein
VRKALSVLCLAISWPSSVAAQTGQDSIVVETEKLLREILSSANSYFGFNGSIEDDIQKTLEDASRGLSSGTSSTGFRLYPFLNYNQISVDPNQNYLLARGSIIDFSQTHTLLPNYQVLSVYDSSGHYAFEDKFGRQRSSLRDGTYIPQSDYIVSSFSHQSRNLLSRSVAAALSRSDEKKSGAVRIFSTSVTTNETFRKIFGGDQVAVDAQGNINLSVSGASEKTSSQSLTTGRRSDFTPKFEQKQQFNLRGTIGEKVEILFDQDSEREFDFENSVKLTYTGYDDEILQKLEAGNIELSLPATEFVTASSQNKGLFGVKSIFKFANLNVTTIASLQRGEKTKLSYKPGSGQQTTQELRSYDYAQSQFFFLSPVYRANFETYIGDRTHFYDPNQQIITLEVYVGAPENQTNPSSVRGTATFENDAPVDAIFKKLALNEEYTFDEKLGIIYLRTRLNIQDVLAVYYQTQDGTVFGDINRGGTVDDPYQLKLIRRGNPQPTHSTWDLELKNVYLLGQITPDDAKSLRIRFQSQSGDIKNLPTTIPDRNGQSRSIMEILHVDERGQGGAVGADNQIDETFIDYNRGLLLFPRLRPFDPPANDLGSGFSAELYPTDSIYRFPSFYDSDRLSTTESANRAKPQFLITYTGSSRSTSTISLGINVLEGSEEVILEGQRLERNIGYTIDYFSGTVEILDPRFLLGNAGLEINYEQAQLFQIDKKSIFGARAEYNLSEHGLGQNSFIGTTALFQSQSTINKRVQLGEEPFRNFVWDVNTNLEFESRPLTRAVNWLPFVATTQPSRISFRAEYAHLIPTPNTSNGLIRNPENGVAYIDDFEGVKRTFPLGASRKTWSLSSVPVGRDTLQRGYMIWYQINEPRQNISAIDVQGSDRVTTLGIAFQPTISNPQTSWGGIMRAFSGSASNEIATTQFIDIWIQNQNNHKARLHIDLGSISEDQNGDGRLNSEVKSYFQVGISEEEDRGLDELDDVQEDSTLTANGIPPGTITLDAAQQSALSQLKIKYPWGVINYSRSGPGDDPFGDNWIGSHALEPQRKIPQAVENALATNNITTLKPNGTDQNASDGERRGDTEDLNINGVLDGVNSYFSYTISIDTLSRDTNLLIGKGRESWRLYRIPIQRIDTIVGAPNMNQIIAARVWIEPETNSTDVISFQFTEFQFVNSEWTLPRDQFPGGVIIPPNGKQVPAEEIDKIVEISAVNTEENALLYQKPRNVKTEKLENQSGTRSQEVREQSLAIILNDLPPGASAIITKSLPQSLDFRNYGQLRMFVHGDTTPRSTFQLPAENEPTNSPLRFFLRFGTDINNYFEIEQDLYRNWSETRNNIDIDLSELSRRKFATAQTDDQNRKVFPTSDGKILRIKGNPSLSNIRNLFIGVTNVDPVRGYSGQVWTNELRVNDANDKPGNAAKAALSFNMADLLSMSGLVQYRSAEFRTVEQRFDANGGNITNWGLNGTLNLQKFYLERWGISLPLVFNYNHSLSDPKYLPGNDILVKDARIQNEENLVFLQTAYQFAVDSVAQLIAIGADTTGSGRQLDSLRTLRTLAETFDDRIQTININKGFSFSFSKQKRDENFWLTRYTLDNLTSNFSYTVAESKNPQYVINRTANWSSSTSYTIGFQKKSVKPFSWVPLRATPVIGSLFTSLGATDFNYKIISSASTDFSITSNRTTQVERDASGNPIRRNIPSTLTASRGYGLNLSPLQSLTSAISVKYQSDLRGLSPSQIAKGIARGLNPLDGFDDFVYAQAVDTIKGGRIDNDSLIFNRDFNSSNSFNLSYRPETFSFLTHNLTYNATHTLARQRPPQSAFNHVSALSRRVQIDATYSLRNMIGSVSETVKGQQPSRGRSRRDRFKSLNPGDVSSGGSKDTTKAESENKLKFVTRKIGGALETALNTINDVRFNVSFDNSFAMNGLDQRPTAKYSWFGYSETRNSGFISHLFNFDLDTVQQFNRVHLDSSKGLFTYGVRKSLNYGFNYGFNFTYFTVDLRYDYSQSRSLQSNRETRTLTRSNLFPWLKVSPLPIFYDFTLRVNNIGRWPIFNLMAGMTRNMNVSLTYNSKETQNFGQFTTTFTGVIVDGDSNGSLPGINVIRQKNGRQLQLESITKQETFPQIGYDIQWKGGVVQNITFSNVNQTTISRSSIQTTNNISILSNISFTKRGGFRIPLWFLKRKQLNNEIRFASTFALTKRKSFTENQVGGVSVNKQKVDETTSWSVEPRFDYSFTNRLTGGLFFKYEYNKSLQSGKITRFLAGLNVNISIGS